MKRNIGKELWKSLVQHFCSSKVTYSRLPTATSRWFLNLSRDGDSEGIPVLRSGRNIALCLPGQKGRVHPRMVGMAVTFPPKPPDLKCWHGCAFGHLELLHIPTTLAASSGRCLGAPQPTEAKSTVSRAGHSSEDTS